MTTRQQDNKFEECLKDNFDVTHASLDVVIEWMRKNLEPQDVFVDGELKMWAEGNGYVLKEDQDI